MDVIFAMARNTILFSVFCAIIVAMLAGLSCISFTPKVHKIYRLKGWPTLSTTAGSFGKGNTWTNDLQKKQNLPVFIVLMAQWRFGSSVLGELFNQNPNILYIFETLWPTTTLRKRKDLVQYTCQSKNLSREILRRFANCDFESDYLNILREWGGHRVNKVLCKNTTYSCRLNSPGDFRKFCMAFKDRLSTKVIHADLEVLKPLVVEDGITHLKIIHLVRDPRGSTASRIDYLRRVYPETSLKAKLNAQQSDERLESLGLLNATPEYMLDVQEMNDNNPTVRGMCQWIRENTMLPSDHHPQWLQGRYHLVKYEDFANAPLNVTKRIYDFIGIPLPEEVVKWVQENTHSNISSEGVYSTRRDSVKTARKWVEQLTPREKGQIAEECKDILNLLSYQL